MKERGIDVASLSEKTGIPEASLKLILNEIISPNQAAIRRITETLEIPLDDDLLGAEPIGSNSEEVLETISVNPIEKKLIKAYRQLPEDHWLRKAIEENLLNK